MGQTIAGEGPDGLEISFSSWLPYFFKVGRRQALGDNVHKKNSPSFLEGVSKLSTQPLLPGGSHLGRSHQPLRRSSVDSITVKNFNQFQRFLSSSLNFLAQTLPLHLGPPKNLSWKY
jgi:hypothetical protein